jgi:hypothetical protein
MGPFDQPRREEDPIINLGILLCSPAMELADWLGSYQLIGG